MIGIGIGIGTRAVESRVRIGDEGGGQWERYGGDVWGRLGSWGETLNGV